MKWTNIDKLALALENSTSSDGEPVLEGDSMPIDSGAPDYSVHPTEPDPLSAVDPLEALHDVPPADAAEMNDEAFAFVRRKFMLGMLREKKAFEIELLRAVDALVLDLDESEPVDDIVCSIRAHSDREIYLKPIFFFEGDRDVDVFVQSLVDGVIYNLDRLDRAERVIKLVMNHNDEFVRHQTASVEDSVTTKLLRYLTSRGLSAIDPIPSRASKTGFAYPILDVNYRFTNQQESLRVLDAAEADSLLAGDFVDAWYVCGKCTDANVRLREVCPDCNTSDVQEEEIVHHFRCAYAGPLSDFKSDSSRDSLVCPKCKHVLNHIGVDYDKPSSVFTCRNGHTSQSPPVKAKCASCGSDTPADHLVKRTFKTYRLTPKGKEKALTGVDASARSLNAMDGVVDFDTLHTMLQHEGLRVQTSGGVSCVGAVVFENASELFSYIEREERDEILAELVRIARADLRPVDVLSFRNHSTLVVLAPAADNHALEDQFASIAAAFKDAVATRYSGYEAHISTQVRSISPGASGSDLIEALLSQESARSEELAVA